MIDYHMHTSRCCHAVGTMDEYLAEAEEKGLREIGFADHFPLALLGYKPRVQVTMLPEELTEYIRQIEELKGRSNQVTVKSGVEVDYLPGTEDLLRSLLENHCFDYVIGSIHFLKDWDFTHPAYANDYENRDISKIYRSYFELVWDLCRTGLFDIIGHVDVVKKFGHSPADDLESYWIKTARILKETETCLELNTAGRDAPAGEFYPGRRFLELCCAEGVSITLGSDAHEPEQVGRYFPEALELLGESGCRELTVFKQRKKSFVPILR